MGELLRAVLDASCIDSNPAFYTARLEQTLPALDPAVTFADRITTIECKTDTWFLCTGWQMSSAESFAIPAAGPFAGVATWKPRSSAIAPFTVRDNRSSRLHTFQQLQHTNANGSLNTFLTLAEYILFEPSALIEITQNVMVSTNAIQNFFLENLVTLAGIEYKLPDRPGGWMNGRGKAA